MPLFILLLSAALSACGGGGATKTEAGHEEEAESRTEFTGRIENFFEYDPLRAGKPSQFLIHLTDLSDGTPVEKADVTLNVRSKGGAEVESAYRAYETARDLVSAYEAGVLRQADESREIMLAAYREGVADLVALLDAQRMRSEIRANYQRALFDYYTSIFQLTLATGTEIKP